MFCRLVPAQGDEWQNRPVGIRLVTRQAGSFFGRSSCDRSWRQFESSSIRRIRRTSERSSDSKTQLRSSSRTQASSAP